MLRGTGRVADNEIGSCNLHVVLSGNLALDWARASV